MQALCFSSLAFILFLMFPDSSLSCQIKFGDNGPGDRSSCTMRLGMIVFQQLPGKIPTMLSKFRLPAHATTDRRDDEDMNHEGQDDMAVPACYICLDDEVFFFDHTAVVRITRPTVSLLPEGVPPYVDLTIGNPCITVWLLILPDV